ncbi:MAG: thiamine phosphate synthase [Pseudomonadota bacterium]
MDHETKLYLITPPEIADLGSFVSNLGAVLSTGAVTAVQLRLKRRGEAVSDVAALAQLADAAVPVIQAAGAVALINDLPDIAAASGADGVHLGQSDMALKEARALLGEDALIGVTCHASRHLAMVAGETGADYVAFGAFYPTETKDTDQRPAPDILTWWQETMELPCVAIGGISPQNAAPLVAAGADFLAVSSAVWQHPDGPAAGVTALKRVIDNTLAECLDP